MSVRIGCAVFLGILFHSIYCSAAQQAIRDEASQRQTQRIAYVKHIVKDAYEARRRPATRRSFLRSVWRPRASYATADMVKEIQSHAKSP